MSSSYGSEKSSSSSSRSESSSSSSDSSGSSYSSFSSDSSSSDSSSSSNPFEILRLVIYSYVGIDDDELPDQLAYRYAFLDGEIGTNISSPPGFLELIFDGRLEIGDTFRTIIVDVDLPSAYAGTGGDFEGEDYVEIPVNLDWLPREGISSSGNIFLNAIYLNTTKVEEIFVAGLLPTRDDSATTHKATIRVFPDGFFTIIIPD